MVSGRMSACCFTGPRPRSSGLPYMPDEPGFRELQKRVESAIVETIGSGYTTFYTGMAQGWDILCGEVVAQLRDYSQRGIQLIAALPFPEQDARWDMHWKDRYDRLLNRCDKSVAAASDAIPRNSQYLARNHYMVDHTSLLICFLVGNPLRSGTAATVRYAQKQSGYRIVNLAAPTIHRTNQREYLESDELPNPRV